MRKGLYELSNSIVMMGSEDWRSSQAFSSFLVSVWGVFRQVDKLLLALTPGKCPMPGLGAAHCQLWWWDRPWWSGPALLTQRIHGILFPLSPNIHSSLISSVFLSEMHSEELQTVESVIFRMSENKRVQMTLRKLARVILKCKNLMHSFSSLTVFEYTQDLAPVLHKFWSLFSSFIYFFLWKLIPLAD